jgi:DNA mismatch repair protein MutL
MAAGEVIDSLAAAVRELVENALDAGSTRITTEIWPELWQLRVTDNGEGISTLDLPQAALSHTTSKRWAGSGRFHASTLGFRGEALHSLAQMGSLSILSRASRDPHGWCATYAPTGSLISLHPAALGLGTVVTVTDLFHSWPSRRLIWADIQQQVRQVVAILQNAALAHPHITWKLQVRDQPTVTLWPAENPMAMLLQILPCLHLSDLGWRKTDRLQILLGLPDRCHRPRPDWIKMCVNGRFVQMPDLIRVVQAAFQQTLPRHRYPICLVYLRLPAEQVDWNRHPAKTDLYLQDQESIHAEIQTVIGSLLQSQGYASPQRATQLLKAREPAQRYSLAPALPTNQDPPATPAQTQLKALAHLQNTYILAEHVTGLWLVEQHVAHERVRYEQLCQQWHLIDLPDPVLLPGLNPLQIRNLEQLGISPEPFGNHVWLIRQLPQALYSPDQSEAETISGVVELSHCRDLEAAKVATACRTAIRNGTCLTLTQMQSLLDQWQTTRQPHTCPHGRPIVLALREKDLARFFRRHWSICDNSQNGSSLNKALGDRFAAEILNPSNF